MATAPTRPIVALVMAAAFAIELLGVPGRDTERGSDWDPAVRQADKLIAAGRFADALPIVLEARRLHLSSVGVLRQLARTYAGLGRLSEEAAAWEDVLAHSPATDDVCVRLSEVYRRLAEPARVAATVERCLPFDPHQPELFHDLAAARAVLSPTP